MGTYVRKFNEINKDMTQECGGKASHLGELTGLGFSVPPGFCVISEAFDYHMQENGIIHKIFDIAESFDFDDIDAIGKKTNEIRTFIEGADIPPDLETEILQNYTQLAEEKGAIPAVAVRSSVAVKDTPISSFPGLMDTYHYIKGNEQVIRCVKKCWASAWTDRAAFARNDKGIAHERAIIAPIVQKMINADIAGIIFTANPITSNKEEMMVEANWGIGESVVSGEAQIDHYSLDKNTLKVKKSVIAKKDRMIAEGEDGQRQWFDVDPEKTHIPTLTDEQIAELGKAAITVENHYDYPQDIEWAYKNGKLYILQTRRITTLKD
jgi:pyruvate,water dikinase